jgi:hypothetical protein
VRSPCDDESLLRTVQTWPRADARLSAAAQVPGLPVPGARKRLVRAQEAVGRSPLRMPSTPSVTLRSEPRTLDHCAFRTSPWSSHLS